MNKEQKFYKALQNVFIGATIEGQGGFINLMRIKSLYYQKIEYLLQQDINTALNKYWEFRNELFDKLYSFFNRYFTESGCIYFNQTPFHNNVYEKVYSDEKDVVLFWKTHMLYYVKTDRIFRSMPIEIDGLNFYFDATKIQNKKANEKRSLVFELHGVQEDRTISFSVQYSENSKKPNLDNMLKQLKKKFSVTKEQLERAFRVFAKQSEVDFFINKNAKEFLREQFNLWSYQYFWEGGDEWNAKRVNQLQILKNIAFKLIDFISRFEDELVQIWNKPKFVKNSNYVITLDRISNKKLVQKIKKHECFAKQVKEWEELGIDKNNPKAPIDTKYFKSLEYEILSQFDNLDKCLDGWLIKSENYQALNTILPKFKAQVQTIYIDPPFNKETDADYFYAVKYKDATWTSLIENRLRYAKEMLSDKGGIFLRCDYNGNWIMRPILDDIFDGHYKNEIILSKSAKLTERIKRYHSAHDSLFFYTKTENHSFAPVTRKREKHQWRGMHLPGARWSPVASEPVKKFSQRNLREKNGKFFTRARIILGEELLPPQGRHRALNQESIFALEKQGKIKLDQNGGPQTQEAKDKYLTDNWTDQVGYSSTWGFMTENHEKVIERTIKTSSFDEGDLVLDFFLGSGTTAAVAHKLIRKWIGVEMGEQLCLKALPRMKEVLAGAGGHEPTGITKDAHWQGGGFFKYYELEQYEETLANCKYDDSDLFNSPSRTPYQQYVFMKDKKNAQDTGD